jgi:regulator of protease activity HflC (stomatin/prohibitin superfamily)
MPPPDENTAVDPTGAAWVVWLVIVGPSLVFVTFACVRRVGPGELVLVVRQGRVVRSRRNGFVSRWPGLERFEPVPTGSRVLPLVVRSRTRDGVSVVALADLTIEVHDVAPGTAYDTTAQAARVAEHAVAEAVERLEVCSLVADLEALEPRWPAQVTRLLPVGTEATALAVTEVEARLTGGDAA